MTTHWRIPVEARDVPSARLFTAGVFSTYKAVESNYGYPQGYAVKPVCEQLVELSKHFSGLNTSSVLACSKKLPALPAGAEGWFAVPRWEKVAETYKQAVGKVLDLIDKTRTFVNYWEEGELGPTHLRLSKRTAVALQMIGKKQKGDFLLIPAQFGLAHRGRSVRRVRVVYAGNEFGLGSFIVGCMILSHPERLVLGTELYVNCPGDEHRWRGDDHFRSTPLFHFIYGAVEFHDYCDCNADRHYGSASAFVSQ